MLVGVKRLHVDSEQRILQWLEAGLAIPNKDDFEEHKKTYCG